MSLGKELLLSSIVMMHISFVTSMPVGSVGSCDRIRKEMVLPLCNLWQAEKAYVDHMFKSTPPVRYSSGSLQPIEGINMTVKCDDAEDIQASFCSISDYLNNTIKSLDLKHNGDIIKNTIVFHQHFKAVLQPMVMSQHTTCYHRNITISDDYDRKVKGLQILYFTRQWVKSFLGIEPSCG